MLTAGPGGPCLDRLLVVGTGLIGGSFAAAAREAGLAREVWGVDPHHAESAQHLGLVDRGFQDLESALQAVEQETAGRQADARSAQALVLATPVPVTARLLAVLARWPVPLDWAWVTELGSTKRGIVEALSGLSLDSSGAALLARFVASHPMAGSEQSGPEAARASLYQGARVLISPPRQASADALEAVTAAWGQLGALPVRLDLAVHDQLLAATSHFPHLIAYALAGALAGQPTASAAQRLHGGGLRDTTRIAASSPALWADILLDNRLEVLALLEPFQAVLSALADALVRGDAEALQASLAPAAAWRHGFVHPASSLPLDDELSE